MRGRIIAVTLSILACASMASLSALSGCARVKPYQREYLSRPSMTSDRSADDAQFQQHVRGAREGADGGSGEPGGGCGCN